VSVKSIPLHALVLLVGPSGAGKSTLCEQHFRPYEVISTDAIRAELVNDHMRQDINEIVFDEVRHRAALKLSVGERVVIDATHLKTRDRESSAKIGVDAGVPVVYLVYDRPLPEKMKTQGWRHGVIIKDKTLVEAHHETFKANEQAILRGDNAPNRLVVDARTDEFVVVQKPNHYDLLTWIKEKGFAGIAVIGDVHNMSEQLMDALEYAKENNLFVVQLGDVVDYGPDPVGTVDFMYDLVTTGRGMMILGNHERKYKKVIEQLGKAEVEGYERTEDNITVMFTHGTRETFNVIEALPMEQRQSWERKFMALYSLARHHLRIGNLTFVHGAIHPGMLNSYAHRLHGMLENMAMFGQTDGTKTVDPATGKEFPTRLYDWMDNIPAHQIAIVGHDYSRAVDGNPDIYTNPNGGKVVFADTGCGKGGPLTMVTVKFTGNDLLKMNEIMRF